MSDEQYICKYMFVHVNMQLIFVNQFFLSSFIIPLVVLNSSYGYLC